MLFFIWLFKKKKKKKTLSIILLRRTFEEMYMLIVCQLFPAVFKGQIQTQSLTGRVRPLPNCASLLLHHCTGLIMFYCCYWLLKLSPLIMQPHNKVSGFDPQAWSFSVGCLLAFTPVHTSVSAGFRPVLSPRQSHLLASHAWADLQRQAAPLLLAQVNPGLTHSRNRPLSHYMIVITDWECNPLLSRMASPQFH